MNNLRNYFKMWLLLPLAVLALASCDDRQGITSSPITTVPTVSSTNPINAETDMPFNQQITATFSEEMNSSTITTASFTLMQGTSFVSGTVTYKGTIAAFVPSSNLAPNTLYTATITTMAKSLMGKGLAENYIWSFTTGIAPAVTPPSVSLTDPINAATGIPINQKIAATFSVAMDATTITSSTFTVRQGTTPVPGFVSYSGITGIFAPSSNLSPNTAYSVTITTGAKDLAGNALVNNYVWSFTTGATAVVTAPIVSSTDPINSATGIPINQKISATFSNTMDAATITTSTFNLKQGTTSVSGFVSYTGATAIFAPASNLAPNTEYTVTITTGAKNLAGNAIANNYIWSFTTGAAAVVTPPTVSSSDPINAATAVPFNQKISATFSKTMDASTITTATFTLMQGTTFVSGTVGYVGMTGTYTPSSNLLPNTTYTATITTGAKDLAGNAIVNNYVWSFTTGAAVVVTPPTVSSTDPINAATGVALNQKVAAIFSKSMDASTITSATFTLKQGANSVSGFVSYFGTSAIFAPASNLLPNTLYTATITNRAKDLAGNALANNYVWSFTTGAAAVVTPPTVISTDPVDAATGVPFNKKISATFSKTMNASTITSSTFILKQGTTSVSGFVSYSGTSAIFAPGSNLLPNTLYTATITSEAKDLAGNAMANNYVWSFTTGTAAVVTPPTVISTDPDDDEICVPIDKLITATFSKSMNASTITTAIFSVMEVQGVAFISGTVSYSGNTATFTPLINLKPKTKYSATITTGAQDLEGNSVGTNYVWSFTTVEPYKVTLSSNPALGGTTSGGGTFNSCSLITVTASPNNGYTFTNWTESGIEVSADANYTFTLNANRTLVANFKSSFPIGQLPVVLGTAARFAILSNSDLTNIPTSSITGDVGMSPGLRSNMTGFVLTPDITNQFSTDPQVNGGGPGIYAANDAAPTPSMLIKAKADAEAAYLDATAALRGTPTPLSGNINGLTLVPGLYESGSSIEISPGGAVTLDAGGNNNAVFIIRSATSITTQATSKVVLAGNANPANIFWVAGSAVTLGTNSIMKGTIIASSSISLLTGANLVGRVLIQSAAAGQISLDQNTIVLP